MLHIQLGNSQPQSSLKLRQVMSILVRLTRRENCTVWGRGVNGELGRDVLLDSTTPTAVNMNNFGTESVKQVVAGDKFTCASTVEGTAFCWGYNDKGRTGVGLATGKTQYPTAVKGLNGKKVESISAGDSHACAVISGGQEVYCWGKISRVSWVIQHLAIEILLQKFLLVVLSFLEEDC